MSRRNVKFNLGDSDPWIDIRRSGSCGQQDPDGITLWVIVIIVLFIWLLA